MRRGEAGKQLRLGGKWMRPSERIVFLTLLEKSDNADCTVPAWRTPSLADLADEAGYSVQAVMLAISHLEKHGWLTRTRSAGGRGHKSGYRLAAGNGCPADTPTACLSPPKQANGSACLSEKQANGLESKQANEHSENGRSDPVSHQGINEGEGLEGKAWPVARIPGVSGPLPADGATRRALHVLTDILGPVTVVSDEPN